MEGPSVLSPLPRVLEAVGLSSEGAQLIDLGLSTKVVDTILHFKSISTKKALHPEVERIHFIVRDSSVGVS